MGIVQKAIDAVRLTMTDNTVAEALEAVDGPAAFGEMYVGTPAETTITGTGESDYFDLAGTWVLSDEGFNIAMPVNGQLKYVGDISVEFLIVGTVSLTVAGTNDVIHLELARNGVQVVNSDATQKFAVNGDVGNMTTTLLQRLEPNDYINMRVRNETATDGITAVHGNIVMLGLRR